MKHYLVKIEFDCNDGDYVYGLQVIDELQKEIIDRNLNKSVSFGNYDWHGGNSDRRLDECIEIEEITDAQKDALASMMLLEFGEYIEIEDLDDYEVWKDYDDDDEYCNDDDYDAETKD